MLGEGIVPYEEKLKSLGKVKLGAVHRFLGDVKVK